MGLKFNPFTGTLDYVLSDSDLTGYIKRDQTIYQTIENGLPLFEDGVRIGNSTTYFELDGNDLNLYVNGVLRQTWTTIPVALSPRRASLWFLMPYVSST